MAEDGRIAFATTLSNELLLRQAEEAKGAFRGIAKTAEAEGSKIDSTFKKIGTAVAGYFSVTAATNFAKQIVKVRGEVESLEVSFKTLLGSEKKATSLMADLRDFAASTPMNLQDLAKGAQTLLGFNMEAEKVMPTLQAIGDISMGNSQKFNSLTLAFAQMSSTGRLMGQDLLQMVNAGFNPLMQISEKTGKSIAQLNDDMSKGEISVQMVTEAFMDATSEGGKFYGMLEQQSKTIQGAISNLTGALEDMFNDLGEKMQEPLTRTLNGIQKLIQHYETIGRIIQGLIATYGTYKTAIIAYNAVTAIQVSLTKGYTLAMQAEYAWLLLVEKAQKLLNKTMLKNPYVLVATAVVGLISTMVVLAKRTSEAEKAQKALNDAMSASKKRQDDLKQMVDEYLSVLDDSNKTEAQHKEALIGLKREFPELLKDCETYNDFLEQRADILKNMPRSLEVEENKILEERVRIEKELLALEKERADNKNKALSTQGGAIYTETGVVLSGEFAKKEAEISNSISALLSQAEVYFDDYYEEVENGTKISLDSYIKQHAKADAKVLEGRLKIQKQAEFDAKPIEQRIAIKEASLKNIEARIERFRNEVKGSPFVLTLKLLESSKKTIENEIQELKDKAVSSVVTTDFAKAVRETEKAEKNARNTYKSNATEANKSALETAIANTDSAKKNYALATGKDYDQQLQDYKDRIEQQKELNKEYKEEQESFAKWLSEQAQETAFAQEQVNIDAMQEGFEKELQQLKLNNSLKEAEYDSYAEEMLERIRDFAEKQYKAQKPDKSFDRASLSFDNYSEASPEVQAKILEALKILADKKQQIDNQAKQEQERLLQKQLDGIKTYLQQREELEKEYAERRKALYKDDGSLKDGITEGNVSELNRQENDALSRIDEEFAMRSDTYQAWCNEIATMTLESLQMLLEQTTSELEALQGAEGVNEQELAEARAKVAKLTQEIKKFNSQSKSTTSSTANDWKKITPPLAMATDALAEIGRTMSESGNEAVKAAGKYIEATSDILKSGMSAVDGIMQLTSGTIGAIQSTTTGATTAMESTATTAATAISSVEKASVILAIISAALQIIQKVVNLVKDAINEKYEKRIEQLEGSVDSLEKGYDNLGKQAEKTFGESNQAIREQQIELRKIQKELLQTAIAEEQAKKDPDESRIDEWQNQIDQIDSDINTLGEDAVNAIFGEDITSAIENFGDALADAWATGASASESANKYMRNMIKQTVMQAILDYIQAGKKIDEIRSKISAALSDDIIDENEMSELEHMAETLMNEVSEKFDWAQNLFEDEANREGTKKGIAAASQESIDELNGRMTAVQGHTFNISENSNIIRDTVVSILGSVQRIERNTEELYTIKTTLNDIKSQGVKIKV